jgi:hypothetical protein
MFDIGLSGIARRLVSGEELVTALFVPVIPLSSSSRYWGKLMMLQRILAYGEGYASVHAMSFRIARM